MQVHVIVASRHDGTLEVARAIGEVLSARGYTTDVTRLERDGAGEVDLQPGDAVILGSAVYAGEWMGRAQRFVEHHAADLHDGPLWLFSAGAKHGNEGAEVDTTWIEGIEHDTEALGHHVFLSRIDPTRLSFGERFVAMKKELPTGDFRDWGDIRSWAHGIADQLDDSSTQARTR
jgi:menaquinone-dependent protoporphyrinogen oxidase